MTNPAESVIEFGYFEPGDETVEVTTVDFRPGENFGKTIRVQEVPKRDFFSTTQAIEED